MDVELKMTIFWTILGCLVVLSGYILFVLAEHSRFLERERRKKEQFRNWKQQFSDMWYNIALLHGASAVVKEYYRLEDDYMYLFQTLMKYVMEDNLKNLPQPATKDSN